MDESRRVEQAVQEREHERAALRAEMAAARIAAAKQEAELQELRALVTQLRHENGAARQASLDATHLAEARQTELAALKAARDQTVIANAAEPTSHDRHLAILEATVDTLSQELAQLKQTLTAVTVPTPVRLPKAKDPKTRASQSKAPAQGEQAAASNVQSALSSERIIPAMHLLPDEQSVSGRTHITVQPGDTLWGLARRHKTTIEALRMANGIPGDHVMVGRALRLP